MYGIREECAQNLTRSLFAVALCNLTEVVALALVLVGRSTSGGAGVGWISAFGSGSPKTPQLMDLCGACPILSSALGEGTQIV